MPWLVDVSLPDNNQYALILWSNRVVVTRARLFAGFIIPCEPIPSNMVPPPQTTSSRSIEHKLFDEIDGTVDKSYFRTSDVEVTGALND